MLTEERFHIILKTLQNEGHVTVAELTQLLETSESTIRRDLNTLHEQGKLNKVHGGATALTEISFSYEEAVSQKILSHPDEKQAIAKYAASLIEDNDFIFLDAGTTTELMIEYLSKAKATFITNGISHARKLAQRGFKVLILPGQIKPSTEAIVGAETLKHLKRYHFTKCFLGTNGITINEGLTTPDMEEALIKEEVLSRTQMKYIVADCSKFSRYSSITFSPLEKVTIITNPLLDKTYKDYTLIKEV